MRQKRHIDISTEPEHVARLAFFHSYNYGDDAVRNTRDNGPTMYSVSAGTNASYMQDTATTAVNITSAVAVFYARSESNALLCGWSTTDRPKCLSTTPVKYVFSVRFRQRLLCVCVCVCLPMKKKTNKLLSLEYQCNCIEYSGVNNE